MSKEEQVINMKKRGGNILTKTEERPKRRVFAPEEKLRIVLRGLGYYPIHELCKDYDISPTHYYIWRKQFFDRVSIVFGGGMASSKGSVQVTTDNNSNTALAEAVEELRQEMKRLKKK